MFPLVAISPQVSVALAQCAIACLAATSRDQQQEAGSQEGKGEHGCLYQPWSIVKNVTSESLVQAVADMHRQVVPMKSSQNDAACLRRYRCTLTCHKVEAGEITRFAKRTGQPT